MIAFSFYSRYCRPCRPEIIALHRAVARVNASLAASKSATPRVRVVVLVADLPPPVSVRERLGADTLWLSDRDRAARVAFVPRRFPCTYLVKNHRVRKINRGYGRGYERRVEGWLRQLVAEPRGGAARPRR